MRTITRQKKKRSIGRPQIILTDSQKLAAIQYVTTSGLWKVRLSKFLKIDFNTLERILKRDKSFADDLEATEAEFLRKTIRDARPKFILKTKYKAEFSEETKVGIEHNLDERLMAFLDGQAYMLNARRRELNDKTRNNRNTLKLSVRKRLEI